MTDQRTETTVRRVLAMGETLIDLIVADGAPRLEEASAFQARDGGAPANVAVALARLGVPSAFCGVVGNDPFGSRLRETLVANGVDVRRLRATDEAPTSLAFAWKDERGDGHFRLLRLADRLLAGEDVEAAGIPDLAALVVGSVALAAEPSRAAITRAVAWAAHHEVPICFDVNLRPTLWPDLAAARRACWPIIDHATLLKLSVDDARSLGYADDDDPAAVMARLRGLPPPLVVLTDGARGSWFDASVDRDDPRQIRHVPAFAVEAVEPTGAGDAFTAALISRLLPQWQAGTRIELAAEDLRYAAAAGALATTKPGALDGLPTKVELAALLAAHPESN